MQCAGIINETYGQDMALIRTKAQWGLMIMLFLGLIALPFFADAHIISLVILISVVLIAVHGVNIVLGYCGEITVAQAAFVGVGAYSFAILTETGLPWVLSMAGATLLTGVLGAVFGLPALRVKGFYLLMITLGAQFILVWVFSHWKSMTGGLVWGKRVPEIGIAGIALNSDFQKYFLIVGMAALMTFLVTNIARSKLGRALTAIRDNDLAAEAMGINVFGYKLIAFFICSLYAGIAGCMWAIYTGHLFPDQFYLMDSVWWISMLIVGGMGTIMGAVFGTIFLTVLSELVVSYGPTLASLLPLKYGAAAGVSIGSLVFAIVIILFLIFEPRGINHRWEGIKNYYRLYPFKH